MTERVRRAGPALLLALVVVLAGTTLYFGRDEYQELARERGETIGTQTTVDELVEPGRLRIPDAERKASGLETAELAAAESSAAIDVFGMVMDLQPLVDARARYLAQSGEVRVLRALAGNLETEYRRAKGLYEDDRNLSERAMRQAETEWKGGRERLAAAESALRITVESARHQWGAALADAAFNPGSAAFQALLDGREVLLSVTIPHDVAPDAVRGRLTVVPAAGARAVPATYVGPAVAVGANVSGATHFYRAPGAAFRVGARVGGFLETASGKAAGVVVPERAVVWFAGRSWVYVRDEKEPDIFERTPVSTARLVPGGWHNASGFEPGQEVVVTGAQLLLSEELEYQIRNENED